MKNRVTNYCDSCNKNSVCKYSNKVADLTTKVRNLISEQDSPIFIDINCEELILNELKVIR